MVKYADEWFALVDFYDNCQKIKFFDPPKPKLESVFWDLMVQKLSLRCFTALGSLIRPDQFDSVCACPCIVIFMPGVGW